MFFLQLTKTLKSVYPQVLVEVVESFETELCHPASDLDLMVRGTGLSQFHCYFLQGETR